MTAISTSAISQQDPIGKAAKAAGVKLFVPSEYGVDNDDATGGPILARKKFSELLKEINLPHVRVFTGLWPDYCLVP